MLVRDTFFIKDVPIYMFSTGNWCIVMTSALYRPREISTFVITKKSKFKNSGKNDDDLNGKYQLCRPELAFYSTQLGQLAISSILTALTVYFIQPQS